MPADLQLCPMCKSELNAGAISCKSCGATEIDGWEAAGAGKRLPFMLLAFTILFGPLVFLFSPNWGTLILVGGIGGFFLIRRSWKRKRVWATSASRRQIY